MEIRGVRELKQALKKNAELEDVKRVVKQNGSEMQRDMQRKVPVDTGSLKRSIGLELKDTGLTAKVTPTMEYAPYVEYGTRYMNAQPYVRPAFNAQRNVFLNDMKRLTK